ncbi:MAG: hypothetical protein ISEC1_P1624 [Thiomicrorhabdus sp.]|nr:MAG: hypothetical protein ISEC1_P1624 [Thiomicrorhabdus sp.]
MDVANTIAINTIKVCREKGIPTNVTVVDRNRITQAQLSDTIAPPVSLNISFYMAGSRPVQAGGITYGSVGVSGAPDGMDDEVCAMVGIESVLDYLEMQ